MGQMSYNLEEIVEEIEIPYDLGEIELPFVGE